MVNELLSRLVPDELCALVEHLIPPAKTPTQGGMYRVDDQAALTAMVFVLTSGWAWWPLTPSFRVMHSPAVA
jgi:transposase